VPDKLAIGETRTIVDAGNNRTIVITRTHRAYAYDLADAYNAARTREGTEWYVDHAGALRLRDRMQAQSKLDGIG
jgi:hypothetical protein